MMHFVKHVKYLSEYKLLLTFEDDTRRQVDLAPHLDGAVFEPLKDMSNFKTVHLNSDLDTIVWQNGADMSPDFLYEIGVPVAESVPSASTCNQERLKLSSQLRSASTLCPSEIMQEYFSDRELGPRARTEQEITPRVWRVIVGIIESLIASGALGMDFRRSCQQELEH